MVQNNNEGIPMKKEGLYGYLVGRWVQVIYGKNDTISEIGKLISSTKEALYLSPFIQDTSSHLGTQIQLF